MGTYRPCCLYSESIPNLGVQQGHTIADAQQSDYMKNLRQQFLNGEKPLGCNACWQEESYRSSIRLKLIPEELLHKYRNSGFWETLEQQTMEHLTVCP